MFKYMFKFDMPCNFPIAHSIPVLLSSVANHLMYTINVQLLDYNFVATEKIHTSHRGN